MQITLSGPGDEETQKLVAGKKINLGAQFEKENRQRELNEEDNCGGIEEKRDDNTVEKLGKFCPESRVNLFEVS